MLKTDKKIVTTFEKRHLKILLNAPNKNTFTGFRDYVLMLLLLDTGIRISEAEGSKLSDINWKDNLIKVFGNSRVERYVPFSERLKENLRKYISLRRSLHHDFLFINIDNEPLKRRTMQEKIQLYGIECGINDVRVSAHSFRHTFARMYLLNGGDILTLQRSRPFND